MPVLLEMDCSHYALAEWETALERSIGALPWLEEPNDSRERLRARQVSSMREWLTKTSESDEIPASLEMRFEQQADKWRRETQHLSSPTQMMAHPSYQAILGMAQENKTLVIRLLLRDMQKNRRPWFWALSYLAQDNPIKQADAGIVDKMIKAWVDWGKERHLL